MTVTLTYEDPHLGTLVPRWTQDSLDSSVTQWHMIPGEQEEIHSLQHSKSFRVLPREGDRYFVVDPDGMMREGHIEHDAFPPVFEAVLRETRDKLLDPGWLP